MEDNLKNYLATLAVHSNPRGFDTMVARIRLFLEETQQKLMSKEKVKKALFRSLLKLERLRNFINMGLYATRGSRGATALAYINSIRKVFSYI